MSTPSSRIAPSTDIAFLRLSNFGGSGGGGGGVLPPFFAAEGFSGGGGIFFCPSFPLVVGVQGRGDAPHLHAHQTRKVCRTRLATSRRRRRRRRLVLLGICIRTTKWQVAIIDRDVDRAPARARVGHEIGEVHRRHHVVGAAEGVDNLGCAGYFFL